MKGGYAIPNLKVLSGDPKMTQFIPATENSWSLRTVLVLGMTTEKLIRVTLLNSDM